MLLLKCHRLYFHCNTQVVLHMNSVISIILSIIMAILPYLGSFFKEKSFTDELKTVVMEEDGNDIVLFNEDGEAVSEELFTQDSEDSDIPLLPVKYDARDEGLVTPPKAQGNSGCCWAFAAISAAESSMIKNGLADNTVDYSEAHLAWFGLRTIVKTKKDTARGDGIYSESPFADGGNWVRSVFALARWSGVQTEENIPFDGFPFPEGNYPESERYESYAHLQNSQYIDPADRDGIKQAILDCGSITASYYHSNTFLNITEDNGACYFQRSVKNTNHTIAIVGWDDNYSKDNFARTPDGDGAWLVKNSWGGSWGGSGYLWISYYDTSLSYFVTFEMESADNYENINQYDGFGYKGWGYLDGYNQMSMANIFTTANSETLRAVSFHTAQPDVSYTVEIYTDIPDGGSPTDGTFVTSESGYMKHRGYRTVKLSSPVNLSAKERYSAVVTLTVPEGQTVRIPLEFPEGFDGAHEREYYGEEGQSYLTVSRYFDEWEDTVAEGFNNVCVKTFTDNNALRLKITSGYRISDGVLGFVSLGADNDYIISQFKNRNVSVTDEAVYLLDNSGKVVDSLEIAYLGDIDNDGDMDYDDCRLLCQMVCLPDEITKKQWFSANVDRSTHLNVNDYTLLYDTVTEGGAL